MVQNDVISGTLATFFGKKIARMVMAFAFFYDPNIFEEKI